MHPWRPIPIKHSAAFHMEWNDYLYLGVSPLKDKFYNGAAVLVQLFIYHILKSNRLKKYVMYAVYY